MSERETKTQSRKPKTSKLAIWSMVLAIGGSLIGVALLATLLLTPWLIYWPMIIGPTIIFSVVGAWILGLIMGIVALAKIKESSGILKGRGFAIAGVVTSGVWLTLACLCIMRARRIHSIRKHSISPSVVCSTNLRGLGTAMQIYANDYDEQYPTAEKWCDLLVMYCGPRQFVCPSSDAKEGESSFAFNKNLIDMKPIEVPPDVVLLFETKGGWNQFGGPEILTTENHEGKGCNVLFNDGSVRFVKIEQLGELRWKVEEANSVE